jgi:hypothetical protein
MASRQFRKIIYQEATASLEPFGFKEMREGFYSLAVREGVWGTLAFNISNYPKLFEINPIVGVHFSQLERTISVIEGCEYSQTGPPSIGTTIHFLLGKESTVRWEFDENLDVQAQRDTVASMVNAIKAVGIPYILAHSSFEKLPDALPWNVDNYGTQYRVPVLLAMLGRSDEARSYVENYVQGFPTTIIEGTYDAQYIAFANRFYAYLDAGCKDSDMTG